jgi:hypothetical protein
LGQNLLRAILVVILAGCGGTGSWVARPLLTDTLRPSGYLLGMTFTRSLSPCRLLFPRLHLRPSTLRSTMQKRKLRRAPAGYGSVVRSRWISHRISGRLTLEKVHLQKGESVGLPSKQCRPVLLPAVPGMVAACRNPSTCLLRPQLRGRSQSADLFSLGLWKRLLWATTLCICCGAMFSAILSPLSTRDEAETRDQGQERHLHRCAHEAGRSLTK